MSTAIEGPLDLLLGAGAAQKVDLAPHLDPGAGRAVSRLRRAGAGAAAGACGRLSRDGGLARLSQVAPAAAGTAQGRGAERRPISPRRWRCACAGWRRSAPPPSKLAAREPAGAGRLRARRAGGRSRPGRGRSRRPELYDLLSAYAHQRQKRVQGAYLASAIAPSGRWSRRARRCSGWSAKPSDWTELDGYLTRYMASHGLPPGDERDASGPRLCRPCWRWCGKGCSTCSQDEAFAPIYVAPPLGPAAAGAGPSPTSGTRHDGRGGRAVEEDGRRRRGGLRAGRCASSRRCCSPPPSRCRPRSWRARLPEGIDIEQVLARLTAASMRRAASTCVPGRRRAGPSARRPTSAILLAATRPSRRASCRAPRSRRWPSSPITSR